MLGLCWVRRVWGPYVEGPCVSCHASFLSLCLYLAGTWVHGESRLLGTEDRVFLGVPRPVCLHTLGGWASTEAQPKVTRDVTKC